LPHDIGTGGCLGEKGCPTRKTLGQEKQTKTKTQEMKTLERSTVKEISVDIMEALKAVALKHGVQFSYKGGNFSPTSANYRIEAAVIADGGVVITAERRDFPLYANMFGLKPEWLDKSFVHGSDTFTIIGLSTRKSKNPVMAKSSRNGKTYVFPANTVAILMNSQHPTPITA
jgi:hypothetical protein